MSEEQKNKKKKILDSEFGAEQRFSNEKRLRILKSIAWDKNKVKRTQYRINIPSEFALRLGLNDKTDKKFEAVFHLTNEANYYPPQYKLVIEIKKEK